MVLDKIRYFIKCYIQKGNESVNDLALTKMKIDLLNEVTLLINENYFENRFKICLLLNEIYNKDTYSKLFLNRIYSDKSDISDLYKILQSDKENALNDYEVLNQKCMQFDIYKKICNTFLIASSKNIGISKYYTDVIKDILLYIKNEYQITDKDLAIYFNELNYYSQKVRAKDKSQILFINSLYEKVPMIVNMGFEEIIFDEVNPSQKKLLDNYASFLKEQVFKLKNEEIIFFITNYIDSLQINNEKNYIFQKIMADIQDELINYYSFIIDIDMSMTNENRKMLTADYEKYLNIYLLIRDYYEKNLNKDEIIIEDIKNDSDNEKENKEEKVLIYSSSLVNPLNAKIISDLKDIPEEYYENILDLITNFKHNTLPKSNIKMLKNNNYLNGVYELKGFQTRILYRQVKDNIYVMLGVFNKKSDNDMKKYNIIGKRPIPSDINNAISISKDIEDELFKILNENKRTSSL